ncbi:MAG: LptA/OstA family protein [Limisphaerales bacterium]
MKKLCLVSILMIGLAPLVRAQTNSTASGPLTITSRMVEGDFQTRTVTYIGDVRADDPQMKLTCDWMMATLPQSGGQINRIVCTTNVVIDTDRNGQTNHFTSDKAVYVYNVEGNVTNKTVTLTGNPRAENAQTITTGDSMVCDLISGQFKVTNQTMKFKQGLTSMTGTNAAPTPK